MCNANPATGEAAIIYGTGRGPGSFGINLITGKLSRSRPQAANPDVTVSPSKRYRLWYDENDDGTVRTVYVKDAKGRVLDRLSEKKLGTVVSAAWSPKDDWFVFLAHPDEMTGDNLYVYLAKERRLRRLATELLDGPTWSPDGHYLSFVRDSTTGKRLGNRVQGLRGTAVVLDARRDFKTVLSTGEIAINLSFSPSGRRIAFVDLVKDEYGDYDNSALRAADLVTGRVYGIATGRRKPSFAWAGDDSLAVTGYDRYAVPTLSLAPYTGGVGVKLVTDREAKKIEPAAYIPLKRMVVYRVIRASDGLDNPNELWSVEPGRAPVCLFPKNARSKP